MFTEPHLFDTQRWRGKRIGLLGGSFNPPHQGHVHISLETLRTLQLDAIWWLVTPQNPLKQGITPLPLSERMDLCRNMTKAHPKILISDLEKHLDTTLTYFTVKKLKVHFPTTQFLWITGMDNARSFHKWHYWQDLLDEIPTAHITRMPATSLIQNFPLRQCSKQNHVLVKNTAKIPLEPGFTYWLMQKKMVDISSTELREKAQ